MRFAFCCVCLFSGYGQAGHRGYLVLESEKISFTVHSKISQHQLPPPPLYADIFQKREYLKDCLKESF